MNKEFTYIACIFWIPRTIYIAVLELLSVYHAIERYLSGKTCSKQGLNRQDRKHIFRKRQALTIVSRLSVVILLLL